MGNELKAGRSALYKSVLVEIVELVGHDQAVIAVGKDRRLHQVRSGELLPVLSPDTVLADTDLAKISPKAWAMAKRRATAISGVLAMKAGRTAGARRQAAALGISERQFWRLVQVYAEHHSVTCLLPQVKGRKSGTRMLDPGAELVIVEKIEDYYLQPERTTPQALRERIATTCRDRGLLPPGKKAVAARLKSYRTRDAQRRRVGSKKAKYAYVGMAGHVEVSAALERVEIDHTPMDVMACSDDPLCEYIGRPWLTVAIDVYTRCVLGIHIGFEPPSVLSVALCLTHAVLPKNPASEFGVPMDWPTHGLPKKIVVDNGRDFVSEAFRRGCEEYGIVLAFRPAGSPHYGGTIERLIGTMVGQCHLLPGTTKNSIKAKGDYNSAKQAAMTLSQVRRWFVEQLLGRYHIREHRMLRIPPLVAWQRAIGG